MAENTPRKITKKILFLKKNRQSLSGAEKYLIKRGWKVVSTHELKVSVLKAVELKPDYIFIAFDHPNQKVSNLPKVFKQILTSTIVPFLETQSSFSLHLIKQAGYVYSLLPPITGPKIERLIHKINYDLDHPQETQQESTRQGFAAKKTEGKEEMVIKIKGSSQNAVQNDSKPMNFSNLSSLLSSNDLSHDISTMDLSSVEGAYFSEEDFTQLLSNSSLKKLTELCPEVSRLDAEPEHAFRKRLCTQLKNRNQAAAQAETERVFMDEIYAKAIELLEEQTPHPHGSADGSSEALAEDHKQPLLTKAVLEKAMREMMEFCPESLQKADKEKEEDYSARMLSLLMNQMHKNNVDITHLADDFQSLFQSALENSTFKTLQYLKETSEQQEVKRTFAATKKAHCYMIESAHFNGYLVVAAATDQLMSEKFSHLVEKRLKDYLKDLGHNIEFSAALDVQFQEVDFQAWSLEKAEFLHKSVSEGQEIAMAFFSAAQTKLEVKESRQNEMCAVDIQEFMGEIPVEFSLFVHLQQNNRFVHYTQAGFVLYQKQKQRLENKGISELHIQNEDLPELKKYRVQNYLNKIIQEHKVAKGGAPNDQLSA